MTKPPRASGKWLAPTLLGIGVTVGVLGIWVMVSARVHAGAYFEVLATDGPYAVALRHQDDSPRVFLELIEIGHGVRWQAMVPPYAGTPTAPGLAASPNAITVRVRRDGRDELWAMATRDAEKLGQLGLEPGAAAPGVLPPAVVTVADNVQSFEFAGAPDRATTIVGIELAIGSPKWRIELGKVSVRGAWLDDKTLWIDTGAAPLAIDRATGKTVDRTPGPHDAGAAMRAVIGTRAWPVDAIPPAPQHLGSRGLWIVHPDRLELVDRASFAPITTISAD
ncbi:MAG: hypothetical protein K8W52_24700 [Deltaproteobacteria bacterium]|nr:hypothetical protein [Deltaproteobacteria bacterium]